MKILAIGDVVGKNGCAFLRSKLKKFKEANNIDFVIANGENSAEGNGMLPNSVGYLFDSGVDVVTSGNHAFRRREIFSFLSSNSYEKNGKYILRPYNYPSKNTPGKGICKAVVNGCKIAVINILGVSYLECLELPLDALDRALSECEDCNIKIVDFHAEATAEKRAFGFYADGKVSAVFGTHTHVQTSDEEILPYGTGYITDLGMTGVIHSVLGVKKELSIKRMKERMPVRFENAVGDSKMECALFDIDENSGKTTSLTRFRIL